MDRSGSPPYSQGTAIGVGLAIMLLFWLLDAALDAGFRMEPFWRALFSPAPHDLAMRLLFVGCQLLFLSIIVRIMKRCREQGLRLQEALLSAESEKARSAAILECVGDAISIQDLGFKVLYQNQAHIARMGYHVGDYCYQAYRQNDEVCPHCTLAQSFQDGQPHRHEGVRETSEGNLYFEILSTPLRDASGRIVAGIEAVRDVTDRKRAELEVQRVNRELELRARELAEANRELESFNYSLSHDLRSYITRISTAQQILSLAQAARDPELRYTLQSIESSCREMDELIEAMLVLSQLSRQEVRWEVVQLSTLAQEVALHLRQQECERQVEFLIPEGLVLRGDRHLLKIVLENLFGNAWKYTGQAARPVIELGAGTTPEGEGFFYVRDNGIGFDMAEQASLFVPFRRLSNASELPGTGVGLATVGRAIARMGGVVWGEGELGKGATFYFTVPSQEDRAGNAALESAG